MISCKLNFPRDFEDYAWEVESKGWFGEACAEVGGVLYRLNFYEPTRLVQDIEDELEEDKIFFIENLVVIELVTRENMEKAVSILAEKGQFANMTPLR